METLTLQEDLEPLPEQRNNSLTVYNRGLLNSNYKEEIRKNFLNSHPRSLFRIKQLINERQEKLTSGVSVALKVSVFVLAYLTIFS